MSEVILALAVAAVGVAAIPLIIWWIMIEAKALDDPNSRSTTIMKCLTAFDIAVLIVSGLAWLLTRWM